MTPGDPDTGPNPSEQAARSPVVDGGAEARVAASLSGLAQLDAQPLAQHAPVYEALHDELQAVLGEIDGA